SSRPREPGPWCSTSFAKTGMSDWYGFARMLGTRPDTSSALMAGVPHAYLSPSFRFPHTEDFRPTPPSMAGTYMKPIEMRTPRYADDCTKKLPEGPNTAIRNPPSAGPTTLIVLNAIDVSATAFGSSDLGTTLETSA